jgi:hypothetical protein
MMVVAMVAVALVVITAAIRRVADGLSVGLDLESRE